MENFKHLPEPFRIRVIEPVKRTTREHRENAMIKSGMNPFLLESEDVFLDLLTDSGTGAVTQNMQAAMLRGDEAYSGSRSYYALSNAVNSIFGYQYTIPTHQGRGAEQIYIPVLIKKREQEKGLDRSKMVAFSNYFFDTTQGHSQINGCTVRNVYIKEAFDTGVRYDFKGNFDLAGLERGIEEVGASNVPYIVATITSNSAGGQPVSLANLKAMYAIAQKYDIPVVMDSARFAENAYFIQKREAEYRDWSIADITRETYKYADMLAMSAKKDAMVPMGGLLCIKDDSFFDVYTECRTLCVVQEGFPTYGGLEGGAMERGGHAAGLFDRRAGGLAGDAVPGRALRGNAGNRRVSRLCRALPWPGDRVYRGVALLAHLDGGAWLQLYRRRILHAVLVPAGPRLDLVRGVLRGHFRP
jgi:tryptophanase